MPQRFRIPFVFAALAIGVIAIFAASLFFGAVSLPAADVVSALMSKGGESTTAYIVMESRLPMAITALLAGAALSAAGLMMQTTFANPLAGPSILGISSGASMGVALIMLASPLFPAWLNPSANPLSIIIGAAVGAGIIILCLTALSSLLRNGTALLIAGIMISYLCSSMITLLNFFAPSDDVKTFAVWGMGSFGGVSLERLPLLIILCTIFLAAAWLQGKPLDAMLLGERYASNLGYDIQRTRSVMLCISGALTAIITAYCGPIGFIGLIVPHICRGMLGTSRHALLMPAVFLCGALIAGACSLACVLPDSFGVIPINSITPIIGVPVIVFILVKRKHYGN